MSIKSKQTLEIQQTYLHEKKRHLYTRTYTYTIIIIIIKTHVETISKEKAENKFVDSRIAYDICLALFCLCSKLSVEKYQLLIFVVAVDCFSAKESVELASFVVCVEFVVMVSCEHESKTIHHVQKMLQIMLRSGGDD